MRVAVHNYYAGQEVAETEFSRRICLAASTLGWEAAEIASSSEIKDYKPDFVLALHFRTPKLTQYATYGSMVTPPVFFARDDQFVKNVLSYDGYLSSSNDISSWLRDILYCTSKSHFIAPWYTSCHQVPYRTPRITEPRLVYAGTNWDGARFKELLQQLDAKSYLDVYGPKAAWSHIQYSYRGVLPFDGCSILNALHEAGVGLCLHREEHCAAGTPSTRIFEIAASGAIAICQEHPFIREAFGDSVLYIETGADVAKTISQISEHIEWIKENQDQALQLSKRAYNIFSENYTLERLLTNIGHLHQGLLVRKGFVVKANKRTEPAEAVQFIIRVGDRDAKRIERALESLASQTEGPVGAIIVQYRNVPGLNELLDKYSESLSIKLVESLPTGFRSSQLWDGLRCISSKYFGILDDDDLIYPNHVHSLLQLLDSHEDCGLAYSGAVQVWESRDDLPRSFPPRPVEQSQLAYFEPFDLNRLVALDNFITSNAFIAKSYLLKDLGEDPHLPVLEDLFLLLRLSQRTNCAFSFEATAEFSWRGDRGSDAVWLDRQTWISAAERINTILWGQSFCFMQNVKHGPNRKIVELETALCQVRAELADELARVNAIRDELARVNARVDLVAKRLDRYLDIPFVGAVRRIRRVLLRLPPPTDD